MKNVLGPVGLVSFFTKFDIYLCKLTIPTSSQDCFSIFYTHIIQHWKEFLFGSNLELHKFDAFLRFEATVQLQIEATGKILDWSIIFGPKICWKQFSAGQLFLIDDPYCKINQFLIIFLWKVNKKSYSGS